MLIIFFLMVLFTDNSENSKNASEVINKWKIHGIIEEVFSQMFFFFFLKTNFWIAKQQVFLIERNLLIE